VVATTRKELDGAEAWAFEGEVKEKWPAGKEIAESLLRHFIRGSLHKDCSHTDIGPVCLEKEGLLRVDTCELEGFKKRGFGIEKDVGFLRMVLPKRGWNGFTVEAITETSERGYFHFVEGKVASIKTQEGDDGMQLETRLGQGPLFDERKLRCCGKVTGSGEVMAKPFDTVEEVFTFLEFEAHTVLDESDGNAFKEGDQMVHVIAPKKDVIDNVLIPVPGGSRDTFCGELHPFFAENSHDSGVNARTVHGTKGKDSVGVLAAIRSPKGELLLGLRINGNLMEALHGVECNEEDGALRFCKALESVETARNRE
jgi:hypothetical protein